MRVQIEISDFARTINFLFIKGPAHLQPGDVNYVALPVQLKFKRVEEGMPIKPTLSIDGGREFLQSLRDALDDLGIPSNRHAKVEGLLEATKAHLKDMRELALKHD